MRPFLLLLMVVLISCLSSSVEARQVKPGELFHITGCENGELMVPEVNIWSVPGGLTAGATVVGRLSGDGRKDQGLGCQGSVVRAIETKNVEGRIFIKIKTIVGSNTGWVTDSFIGKRFNRAKCKTFFSGYPKYVANCIER